MPVNHPNRGRLVITLDGPWRLYQRTVPPDWTMLGTVQRGMSIGALARSSSGVYVQLNSDVVVPLNQRKVMASLQPPGAKGLA